MSESAARLTIEELHHRIRAAGVAIPAARLPMILTLLADALTPIRAMDPEALAPIEPAVTFDAAEPAAGADHGNR